MAGQDARTAAERPEWQDPPRQPVDRGDTGRRPRSAEPVAVHVDPKTGDLYVGDVGEYVRESIKYAPAAKVQGTNFGWPCFEGNLPSTTFPASMCPGRIPPLYEYAREGGNCAVSGGEVVHDPRLPKLSGHFLYADYCLGEINVLHVRNGKLVTKRSLHIYAPGITSFGTDALQRIYITLASGAVCRLDPAAGNGSWRASPPGTGGEVSSPPVAAPAAFSPPPTPAAPMDPTSTPPSLRGISLFSASPGAA